MKKNCFCLFVALVMVLFTFQNIEAGKGAEEKFVEAPKFPRKGVWLNAKPAKKAFENKVTLVYFWDYTSVNCLRELGYLKEWHDRYDPYGLQLIMVHSPEFSFAGKQENVELALKRLDVFFPVLLDSEFKLWDKYETRSWPTKYLVDENQSIIHARVGEGGYLETENKIREALMQLSPLSVLPEPLFAAKTETHDGEVCGRMSPETYTGYRRASWWGGGIANRRGILPDQTTFFKDRGKRIDRGFFAEGMWTNHEDEFEHARDTDALTDYLGLIYVGNQVYSVMNSAQDEGVSRVYVTRDDVPIPSLNRGSDVNEDLDGNTYVVLQGARLYHLISKEDDNAHELRVWTQDKGVSVNSFSFANRCLTHLEHI